MSDSAPPPPPPENQGGATPPPPPPPAAPPPPPATPYGSAPPPPSAAPGGPQPAGLLERFVARLIDGILIGVVSAVIGIVLGVSIGGFTATAISAVIGAALYLGYFSFLESSRGQTLGKQIMSLRVVGPSGSGNPTMEEAVKRNLWTGLGILGVVPLLGIVGGLLQLAAIILIVVTINGDTARRQSWFDKFAGGTQVLKG